MSRRAMTNFTAGGPAKEKKAKAKAAEPVPQGTVKEILAWVGDDAARAQRALAIEEANDDPRISVLEGLDKVIEAAE